MIKRVKSKRLSNQWVYHYDIRINGRRYRDTGFTSREEVDQAVAALRQSARENRYGITVGRRGVTLKQLIDARIADHAKNIAIPKALKATLNGFSDAFPNHRVDQLTNADMRKYANDLIAGGIKPATVNRVFNDIRSCLRSAGEYFPQLQRWMPPKIPRLKETPGRERIIRADEVAKLLQRLREPADPKISDYQTRQYLADIILIGVLTGMRRGEILRLKWTDINWDWKKIKITRTKTQRVDVIDISSTLESILTRRKAETNSEWIFPGKKGPVTFPAHTLRRICKEIGLPYGRHIEGGFVFHDSRHTFISQLLENGYDLATIQSLSGHSNRTMAMKYGHATAVTRKAAVDSIDKIWSPLGVHNNTDQPANPPIPLKKKRSK